MTAPEYPSHSKTGEPTDTVSCVEGATHEANGDSSNSDALAALTKLGRYRIVRALGKGGFGQVFLAWDEELHREVAIKVPLHCRLRTDGDFESYMAEARLVASLDHPSIVQVYDVGRTADGVCFVVSKYIPGNDLGKVLARGDRSGPRSAT